jgi:anti-sigma B factor antagonist
MPGMATLTIRLPPAPPQAYLAWVMWWREVEELLGSEMAQAMTAGEDGAEAAGHGATSIVPAHVRFIEQQARQALSDGATEISPELSAEPEAWDQWLDYWGRRREWLEALALRGLPVPQTATDLADLWQRTLRVINVELAIDLAHLKNLELVGTGQPGSFRLSGELDLMNVEAVGRFLQEELRSEGRLTLDVSGLTFIDSKGLATLLQLAALSVELGLPPIVLKSPSEVLRRVLEVGIPSPIPGIHIDS